MAALGRQRHAAIISSECLLSGVKRSFGTYAGALARHRIVLLAIKLNDNTFE